MEFIREQIKEKPISKRKVLKKIGVSVACGAAFALTACLVLLLFAPLLATALGEEPKESETEENSYVPTQATEGETESEKEEPSDTEESTEPEQQGPQIIIPEISLDIKDYQELQNQLYQIGNDANKSIVTVTGVISETDWMNNAYETEGQSSGAIIKADDNYLYILTEKKVISDVSSVRITFVDGAVSDGTLLKYDGNTGVAILAVEKRQLEESTLETIAVAKIGNSFAVKNGTIVIALGSPLGTNYSILTGNITSTNNEISTLDKNYDVFTTDIVASEKGSGVLINTAGEIIGMVIQDFSGSQDIKTLTAVSISDIAGVIERLVEGKDVPYVGLYVSTITNEIAAAYGLPKGVFITEVMTDSPAMYAGLQSGDVITQINGEDIYLDATFSSKIGMLIPGTNCEITVRRQSGDKYIEVKCEVTLGVLQ